jgi:hypothetical protein
MKMENKVKEKRTEKERLLTIRKISKVNNDFREIKETSTKHLP